MTKFKIDTAGIINSLIGSLIIFSVSTVYNYFFIKESFTNALINSLNLNIKLWHIIVFIGLIYFISKVRKSSDVGVVKNTPPAYLEYTKDKILGYEWVWNWEKGKYGSYGIYNLTPLCPEDNTLMTRADPYSKHPYICPTCYIPLGDIDVIRRAHGIIKNKVYKKYNTQII